MTNAGTGRPGSDGEHELQERTGNAKRAKAFYDNQVLDHLTPMHLRVVRAELFDLPCRYRGKVHADPVHDRIGEECPDRTHRPSTMPVSMATPSSLDARPPVHGPRRSCELTPEGRHRHHVS